MPQNLQHTDLELSRNKRHEFQKVENFVIATFKVPNSSRKFKYVALSLENGFSS